MCELSRQYKGTIIPQGQIEVQLSAQSKFGKMLVLDICRRWLHLHLETIPVIEYVKFLSCSCICVIPLDSQNIHFVQFCNIVCSSQQPKQQKTHLLE